MSEAQTVHSVSPWSRKTETSPKGSPRTPTGRSKLQRRFSFSSTTDAETEPPSGKTEDEEKAAEQDTASLPKELTTPIDARVRFAECFACCALVTAESRVAENIVRVVEHEIRELQNDSHRPPLRFLRASGDGRKRLERPFHGGSKGRRE